MKEQVEVIYGAAGPKDAMSMEQLIVFLTNSGISMIQSHREKLLEFINWHAGFLRADAWEMGRDSVKKEKLMDRLKKYGELI